MRPAEENRKTGDDMAKHTFGIMEEAPTAQQKFLHYELENYRSVDVNDRYIEPLLKELSTMMCYWHSLNRKELGLCYCGITLIPPESLDMFISAVMGNKRLEELCSLLLDAQREKRFVIHFGI